MKTTKRPRNKAKIKYREFPIELIRAEQDTQSIHDLYKMASDKNNAKEDQTSLCLEVYIQKGKIERITIDSDTGMFHYHVFNSEKPIMEEDIMNDFSAKDMCTITQIKQDEKHMEQEKARVWEQLASIIKDTANAGKSDIAIFTVGLEDITVVTANGTSFIHGKFTKNLWLYIIDKLDRNGFYVLKSFCENTRTLYVSWNEEYLHY